MKSLRLLALVVFVVPAIALGAVIKKERNPNPANGSALRSPDNERQVQSRPPDTQFEEKKQDSDSKGILPRFPNPCKGKPPPSWC